MRQILKYLTLLVSTIFVFTLFPCRISNAATAASGTCGTQLTWNLDRKGTLTISGSGAMTNWSSVDDTPWSNQREFIYRIVFDGNVTSIGKCAFYRLTGVKSIDIPDTVTSIGNTAFSWCTGLESVTIPNSVTSIGDSAFYNCVNLTSIDIPNSVKTLGKFAFASSGLTSIVIPGSIKTIESSAFSSCADLASITISNGVTTIGGSAFSGSALKSIDLPATIKTIDGAFNNCRYLESLTIPDGVTTIGASTFRECVSLKNILIPKGVTGIGEQAFYYCESLANVSIPEGVTSIGEKAFYNCKNLTSIILPDSMKSVGDNAFLNCSGLKHVVTKRTTYLSTAFPRLSTNYFHYYYNVSYSNDGNGTISGKTRSYGTDTVEFEITPNENYSLDKVTWTSSGVTKELVSDSYGKYNMPDSESSAVVSATFKRSYTVSLSNLSNGTATVSKTIAGVGELITVNVIPNPCYELDSIKINGDLLSENTFTMPAANVIVEVKFKSLPHQISQINEKPATCEEDGYSSHFKCNVCNKLFSDAEGLHEISQPVTIAKLGHSWNEGEVTKAPTCLEKGIKIFHCSHDGCTETKTEEIAVLGHKLETIAEKAPSKTETGNIKHYKCERCGKIFSDDKGKNEISQDAIIIPVLMHELTFINAKAATCNEDGNNAYYECNDQDCNCHKVYRDRYGQREIGANDIVVPAIGHHIKEVTPKEPTCTEAGYEKHYKCSLCLKLFEDSKGENEIDSPVVIVKLGHNMTHVSAQAPTREKDGEKEHYTCNRCGKSFADAEGNTVLSDAEIIEPAIGAAQLGETATVGNFVYKVTNPATDGTGTVTLTSVAAKTAFVSIPSIVEIKESMYRVNRIGAKAFYKNTIIKTLYIGSNIRYIDSSAFYGCKKLTKVTGGSRVETIGSYAFAYCSKLKSFKITSSALKKISSYTFKKDKKLKTIYIKNTTKLSKSGVKKSLKGSYLKTVKVKKSKIKKYKKYFKKSNSGRSVRVKK